ncbi:CoA-transferase subunit beta [Leucobacter luti]|uniref:CoA-transferase subunit beta n=1 Tax=Leucobacter luti TaxID=340320 RepID=UPI003D0208C6
MSTSTSTSTSTPPAATRAEVCAAAISDLFRGAGEILASPIGLVPSVGARLARLTHAPELLLSDGEATLFADTPAVDEPFREPEGYFPYSRLFELMMGGKRHVVMGAAQIDRYGNQNLSAIGDRDRPKKQLLGARAAATNTATHAVSYFVPRHQPRVFVKRVDIVTGVGRPETSGAKRFHDLRRVVTNLGVFDFSGPDGTMAIVSLHPGVSLEEARAATGFELAGGAKPAVTRIPNPEELRLIREQIDPRSLREREVPTP